MRSSETLLELHDTFERCQTAPSLHEAQMSSLQWQWRHH